MKTRHPAAPQDEEEYFTFAEAVEELKTTYSKLRQLVEAAGMQVYEARFDKRKKLLLKSDVNRLRDERIGTKPSPTT